LSNIADTLAKLSMDACLYLNQGFDFISFPENLTTGSSIMPHKKNPDVFELIRSYCNRVKALPNEIMLMTTNLPSGYHRDFQLLKEHLFPSFGVLTECLNMASLMISNISVKENIMADDKYRFAFSVEEVNRLVLEGMSFRDAYKKIGKAISENDFNARPAEVNHIHEGSIGNLQTNEINLSMQQVLNGFNFKKVNTALQNLIQ
ncbi:MAG TPA: lyase family protein, partial [Ferruginibacter sp.]|nr:lyase family protein [Ferruginibacter sp.]